MSAVITVLVIYLAYTFIKGYMKFRQNAPEKENFPDLNEVAEQPDCVPEYSSSIQEEKTEVEEPYETLETLQTEVHPSTLQDLKSPLGQADENTQKEKIDKKKLIIYSEILKAKYLE